MRPSSGESRSPAVMAAGPVSRGAAFRCGAVASPGWAASMRRRCRRRGPPGNALPAKRSVRRLESDGETLATLGATRGDDAAATTGLHANEEAVRTGATDFGRLIGALHDEKSPGNPRLEQRNTLRVNDLARTSVRCEGIDPAGLSVDNRSFAAPARVESARLRRTCPQCP